MLCRLRWPEPPSRGATTGRHGVAGPDVRAHAGVHHRGRHLAPPRRRCGSGRFLDDRGDAVDNGGAIVVGAAFRAARTTRKRGRGMRAARGMAMRQKRQSILIAVTDDTAWRALCSVGPALSGWRPSHWMSAPRLRVDRRSAAGLAAPTGRGRSGLGVGRGRDCRGAAATSLDLVACRHLRERGFWDVHDGGVLPGLPWRAVRSRLGSGPRIGRGHRPGAGDRAWIVGDRDQPAAAVRGAGVIPGISPAPRTAAAAHVRLR